MKKMGFKYMVISFGIIFILIFTSNVIATSNEQVISGYHYDPGCPVYARHASIDSDELDVVAAFTTQREIGGLIIYNVQLARSIDGGQNWGGNTWICPSTQNQWYPDIQMVDIPGYGKIVFIVWQESDDPYNSASQIYTMAVYFTNFNGQWHGVRALTGSDIFTYPRIAGSITGRANDGNGDYDLVRMHYIWEAHVGLGGQNHWEIQMASMYWENEGDTETINWGGYYCIASGEGADLRHPSIDADVPDSDLWLTSGNIEKVVLTYDCRWRDQGTTDVRFKHFAFYGQTTDPTGTIAGVGSLIFQEQDSFYFPDITIWGWSEDMSGEVWC